MWFLGMHISEQQDPSILNKRSFFGVLHVYEYDKWTRQHSRSLYHGRIRHGKQWLHPSDLHQPTSYYGTRSGVALALNRFPSRKHEEAEKHAIRVGVIGLGVGTMHITNLHVDLSDVARQMAIHAHKEAIYIEDDGDGDRYDDESDWVLITSNQHLPQ